MFSQNLYGGFGSLWKSRIVFGQLKQFADAADPFGDYNAKLRKMSPQRVDAHCLLLDQQFAGFM